MARVWRELYGVLFGLSIFGFPVVSSIPIVLHVDSRGVSIAYRAMVVALSLLALALGVCQRHARIAGLAARAFAVLIVMLLARMLWDSVFASLPLDLPWAYMWSFAVGVSIVPATVFLFVPADAMLDACHRSAAIVGAAAVLATAVGVTLSVGDFSKLVRLATDVLNPISVGHLGTSLVIICLARVAAGTGRRGSRRGAAARFIGAVAGATVAVASASKGPILALLATLTIGLVLRGEWANFSVAVLRRVLWAAIAAAGVAAVIVALNQFTPFQPLERFSDLFSDPSTTLRTRMMSDALSEFNASPIFGSATVEYHERSYPHNVVVESLMVGGVACFAALSAFLVCAVSGGIRIYRRLPRYRWAVLLFIQYLIDSMLSGSLYEGTTFWVTSLIVIGVAQRIRGLTPARVGLGTKPDVATLGA